MLSGNRNFEARIHPEVKANYLASPPLVVAYALAGRIDIDLVNEPLGVTPTGARCSCATSGRARSRSARRSPRRSAARCTRRPTPGCYDGDETWRSLESPAGDLYAWDPASTYVRLPPYFEGLPLEPAPVGDIEGARCLVSLGDSVTTDHISPAGSIKLDSPAGALPDRPRRRAGRLQLLRRPPRQPRGDGPRHVRERPPPQSSGSGRRGTWTKHFPGGEELTIFEASERYLAEGTPLLILAGKEYGSGSSRDWAAKGPGLLGVKAVIAESYERIHRSNLLMMGILPLQFKPGESRESLGLTGAE